MNLVKQGMLTDANPFVVSVGANSAPMTITLTSASASRLIELSSDGGINYWTPPRDSETAAMVNVSVRSPISHVRFTGVANDRWNVR
jgi:hypothetical protein